MVYNNYNVNNKQIHSEFEQKINIKKYNLEKYF